MFLRLCGVVAVALAATAAVNTTACWAVSVEPVPADMSPEAKLYLDQAIKLLREQHINASKMDWPALTQKAYAAASGAKKPADTYPAIRLIIKALGEKHTGFIDPDHARAVATGLQSGNATPPPLMLPEGMRLANGIGVIRLYGFMGSAEQAKRYTETARTKIRAMRGKGACRFVLDLRENSGGNMYPMLNGISGLLEPGVLGSFVSPHRQYSSWALKGGVVTVQPPQDKLPLASRNDRTAPVAVLIGPQTVSAGEFTAMSFKGRARTRFFGSSSAGFVTANTPTPLSDGAMLVMPNAWGLDRTGKKYVDRIEPDEVTGSGGAAFDAAVSWLAHQPCAATHARPAHETTRQS